MHTATLASIVGAGSRRHSSGGLPSCPPRLLGVRGGLRGDVGEPRPGADRGGRWRARRRDLARLRQRDRFRRREDARRVAMARANASGARRRHVQLTDVTFPPCPPGAPGPPDTCVKVDAFRNQARGNALPMFFGNLVGVSSQGVRATATAQIVAGNTDGCLKPWAIARPLERVRLRRPSPTTRPGSGRTCPTSTSTTGIQTGKGTRAGTDSYVPASSPQRRWNRVHAAGR